MAEQMDLEYKQFLKTLGRRIKKVRKERGHSLRDMVLQHGCDYSQWRRYERGGSMNIQSILKIAKTFGTSLSDLLNGLGAYPEVTVSEIQRNVQTRALRLAASQQGVIRGVGGRLCSPFSMIHARIKRTSPLEQSRARADLDSFTERITGT